MMELNSIDTLSPAQLSQLLSPKSLTVWGGEDSGYVLNCQLQVPLVPDIFAAPQIERLYGIMLTDARFESETFLGAITSSKTPKEIFQAIKEFAQFVQSLPESPLRGSPATVLYYGAIAGCLVKCEAQISSLRPNQIRDGCVWAASQPGAEPLRSVLDKAIALCEEKY